MYLKRRSNSALPDFWPQYAKKRHGVHLGFSLAHIAAASPHLNVQERGRSRDRISERGFRSLYTDAFAL
jgi:hypothetical protein